MTSKPALQVEEIDLLTNAFKQGKGFSIITNFGCDMNCWYCIWKRHPMSSVCEPTNFEKLKKIFTLINLAECSRDIKIAVSISGGGDPLFGFPKTSGWYNKLFEMANAFGIAISMHTAKWITAYDDWLLEKLDEVVIHFTYKRFLENPIMLEEFAKKIPIRMAFVLTGEWTVSMMRQVLCRARALDCRISFRELWAVEDKVRPEALKYAEGVQEEYPQARYVKQADYNLYYMPDNRIYETFMLEQVQ